jgi:hypothetical protein
MKNGLWRLLIGLHWFVAVGALAGGAALVARPDGSLMGMPLALLEHSPFSNFLIPGLVLLLVVGGGHLAAGVVARRRSAGAALFSFGAGGALVGWIVGQVAFLRAFSWLQPAYFAFGAAIAALALWLWRDGAVKRSPETRPA